jgi:hypothetical protein
MFTLHVLSVPVDVLLLKRHKSRGILNYYINHKLKNMKIMPRIFFILLFSCFFKSNFAQVESIPYYDHLAFHSSFSIIAESDAKSNYLAVDLSVFGSSLEKAYFENLAFSESKVTRLDAGNSSIAWFKVKKTFSDEEANAIFLQLKQQTMSALAAMTESQKQEWLSRKGK